MHGFVLCMVRPGQAPKKRASDSELGFLYDMFILAAVIPPLSLRVLCPENTA
jgi:hypothetical protein